MNNLLSITNPYFEYIPDASSLFAILGHDPNAQVWLAARFFSMGICTKSTVESPAWFEDYFLSCPFINCIDDEIEGKSNLVFTNYIQEAINQGFFISLPINVKYISNYQLNDEITHEIFIYGYDDDKKVVFIMDHFKNERFSTEQCTYDEMNEAFLKIPAAQNKYEYRMNIRKVKYTPDDQFTYDRGTLITLLENHLYGINLVERYPDGKKIPDLCNVGKIAFGSHYYDAVVKILHGKWKMLLRRQIHLIYLHLKIFIKLSVIINDEFGIDHVHACEVLAEDAGLLNKKYLKYILLAPEVKEEQVKIVADFIMSIKNREQRIISLFLSSLIEDKQKGEVR